MKFKYVPTSFIPWKEEKVICFDKDGIFETDDKEIIEFLKNHKDVEVIEEKKEKKRGRPPREVKEETEEDKEE